MHNIDLHTHTSYSHGADAPSAMFAAAQAKGIKLYGFSEHSPRPLGFDYPNEYREHLAAHLDTYARDVKRLQQQFPQQVLFGMEMDWLEGQLEFTRRTITAYDYDYLIGSVHFLGTWGFDASAADWAELSQEQCDRFYEHFFIAEIAMAHSGLFHIAAHPDLIKIFSVQRFHRWLNDASHGAAHRDLVRQMLLAFRDNGMAMEVSSAGIRKPCREIYPCAPIMQMAAALHLPICLNSDAHCVADVGYAFPQLESYARAFGWRESVWFDKQGMHSQPFA